MYLVSIYFDEKTDKRIRQMIKAVAEQSGNTYMLDANVPPHITIAGFETRREDEVIEKLRSALSKQGQATLTWAGVGVFFPNVIYVEPVLNKYLHKLSVIVNESIINIEETKLRKCYQPFQWIPHTTIGKKLSEDEMVKAFMTLQKSFGIFEGKVTRIGLAKTNPYEDIVSWDLLSKVKK